MIRPIIITGHIDINHSCFEPPSLLVTLYIRGEWSKIYLGDIPGINARLERIDLRVVQNHKCIFIILYQLVIFIYHFRDHEGLKF